MTPTQTMTMSKVPFDLDLDDYARAQMTQQGWRMWAIHEQPRPDMHTDADLAMALELALEIERDWARVKSVPFDVADKNYPLAAWLHTEVRNALLERVQ